MKTIFKQNKKYTFSEYAEFGHPTEEIVTELGYTLQIDKLNLPRSTKIKSTAVARLTESYYALLPKINLNSEIAKWGFMIAPLLHEIIRPIDAKLNIEYPLDIDEKLSGTVDYLIRTQQQCVVVEAKCGDLDRGFNQLAAELIALDKYAADDSLAHLYGAITIGDVWRFAQLHRHAKRLDKDAYIFRFPEDIQDILSIFYGILAH